LVRTSIAERRLHPNPTTDVTEINTGQGGNLLIVDEKHQYADLDELIVNHVQATARKVEELMAHEKFKHGSEDELRRLKALYLNDWD
jgi:hypothetical protein